jgi:hypothetical protein
MSYKLKETAAGLVLQAVGQIEEGEVARLADAIRRSGGRIAEIWLYSSGGNSAEGVEMGRLLRKSGLATRVPKGALCFSACSMVFLGGVLRRVDPGAYYGVHMWTSFNEEASAKILGILKRGFEGAKRPDQQQQLVKEMQSLLQSIERRNAEYARQRANYLIEMAISLRLMVPNVQTEAAGAAWLCPSELRSYNVVNVD